MPNFLDREDDIEYDIEDALNEESDSEDTPLPPPSAERNERIQEICSLLVSNGYLHKEDARDLLYDDELREHVSRRLDGVGLKLVHNSYSEHWGVGLNDRTSADDRLEWSNNFGLERGAMALLLVLWCKLIMPKRLAQEERQPEDGSVAALFPEIEKMPNPRTSVSRDQIIAEFGDMLGGVSLTSKYIAQLSRAKLIKAHGGLIEEGPLLPLVIDESRLSEELRREVLLSLLKSDRNIVNAHDNAITDSADTDDAPATDTPDSTPTPEVTDDV